jgi:hypothetical protein
MKDSQSQLDYHQKLLFEPATCRFTLMMLPSGSLGFFLAFIKENGCFVTRKRTHPLGGHAVFYIRYVLPL